MGLKGLLQLQTPAINARYSYVFLPSFRTSEQADQGPPVSLFHPDLLSSVRICRHFVHLQPPFCSLTATSLLLDNGFIIIHRFPTLSSFARSPNSTHPPSQNQCRFFHISIYFCCEVKGAIIFSDVVKYSISQMTVSSNLSICPL
jgi:hypothetical protein